MRCIFCKSLSDTSSSREHIVPESLGNTEYVLSRGWVCDQCNNYLARKVEAPFLDSVYGRQARFEMRVGNKDGIVPPATGIAMPGKIPVHLYVDKDHCIGVSAASPKDESTWINGPLKQIHGRLYVPAPTFPNLDYTTSRFIAKVGLEVLAYQLQDVPGSNDEIVLNNGLDDIRAYVRKGRPGVVWPIHTRRIYPSAWVIREEAGITYECLHEWRLLTLPTSEKGCLEVYAVIAIFGIEYVINLGGPILDSYDKWLADNSYQSPLYPAAGGLHSRYDR